MVRNISQMWLLAMVLLSVGLVIGITLIIVMPSWRPPHDLPDQPSYRTFEPASVFSDGRSERPLVTGTVARPPDRVPGIPYSAVRTSGSAGYATLAGTQKIPFAITAEVLGRGQERFNIYCAACHGRTGDGNGMIVQRGFLRPPSFHDPRLIGAPDSHFFEVISNGYGAMLSQAERVDPADRWRIVAYVRALQVGGQQAAAGEGVP